MRLLSAIAAVAALFVAVPAIAQFKLPSAFTYQGRVEKDGQPLQGKVDFAFRLWDALEGGTQIGSEIQRLGVTVTDGLFNVSLDWGTEPLANSPAFLEIRVSDPGAFAFFDLEPRQPITPAPMAVHSGGAVSDNDAGVQFIQNAQTTTIASNPNSSPYVNAGEAWQSFSAIRSGRISAIRLLVQRPAGAGTGVFELHPGTGLSSPIFIPDQGSTIIPAGTSGNIEWRPDFSVEAGQTYTFAYRNLSPQWGFSFRNTNLYAGGQASFGASSDLTFSVSLERPSILSAIAGVEPDGTFNGSSFLAQTPAGGSDEPFLMAAGPRPLLNLLDRGGGYASLNTIVDQFGPSPRGWLQRAELAEYRLDVTDNGGVYRRAITLMPDPFQIGIGRQATPLADVHIQKTALLDTPNYIFQDDVIIEDGDAVLSLISNRGGGFGSQILFKDLQDPTDQLSDTNNMWSIGRTTGNASLSDFQLRLGDNANYALNNTALFHFDGTTEFGIGTDEPRATLHLKYPNGGSSIRVETFTDSSGSASVDLKQPNDAGTRWSYDPAADYARITFSINNTTSQPLSTITMPNTDGRYGYIGLGDVDPTYRLDLPNISGVSGRARANRWDTYSSARFKENIETIPDPIEAVAKLRGVSFNWKQEHGGAHDIGFIAEEVAAIFPDLVTLNDEGQPTSLDYARLLPITVEAIKAQQQTIISQQQRIERLEAAVEQLSKDTARANKERPRIRIGL